MRRRALITGATGFVGSHLAERLAAEGWQLRALVRSSSDTRLLEELGAELYTGDLRDRESVGRASEDVEVVYHLAAATAARDEAGYEQANVVGTRNVVEGIARAGSPARRLVYLSSYAACGPTLDGRPRSGAAPPAPLTAYGRTKLQGEVVARGLEQRGVEVVVVRAPAVYGPRDRALLPYFRLVRWGMAPVPGRGEGRLHLIFAPDLAEALARAADAPPGTYPVASPGEHRWAEVVEAIAEAMGRSPVRIPLVAPLVRAAAGITQAAAGLVGRSVLFNREKAEEMLAPAWICDLTGSEVVLPPEESTPLSEGISATVCWYTRRGWL